MSGEIDNNNFNYYKNMVENLFQARVGRMPTSDETITLINMTLSQTTNKPLSEWTVGQIIDDNIQNYTSASDLGTKGASFISNAFQVIKDTVNNVANFVSDAISGITSSARTDTPAITDYEFLGDVSGVSGSTPPENPSTPNASAPTRVRNTSRNSELVELENKRRDTLNALQTKESEKTSAREAQQANVATAKEAYDKAVDELAKKNEDNEAVKAIKEKKDANDEAIAKEKEEFDKISSDKQKLQDEAITPLNNQIEAQNNIISEKQGMIEAKEGEIEGIKASISALGDRPLEQNFKHEVENEDGTTRTETDMAAYMAAVKEYDDKKQELENQLEVAENELETYKKELEEAEKTLDELEEQLSNAEDMMVELEREIAASEERMAELEKTGTEIDNELKKLLEDDKNNEIEGKEEVQEKLEAYQKAQEELAKIDEKYNTEIATLREELNDLDAQVLALKSKIEQEEKEAEQATESTQSTESPSTPASTLDSSLPTSSGDGGGGGGVGSGTGDGGTGTVGGGGAPVGTEGTAPATAEPSTAPSTSTNPTSDTMADPSTGSDPTTSTAPSMPGATIPSGPTDIAPAKPGEHDNYWHTDLVDGTKPDKALKELLKLINSGADKKTILRKLRELLGNGELSIDDRIRILNALSQKQPDLLKELSQEEGFNDDFANLLSDMVNDGNYTVDDLINFADNWCQMTGQEEVDMEFSDEPGEDGVSPREKFVTAIASLYEKASPEELQRLNENKHLSLDKYLPELIKYKDADGNSLFSNMIKKFNDDSFNKDGIDYQLSHLGIATTLYEDYGFMGSGSGDFSKFFSALYEQDIPFDSLLAQKGAVYYTTDNANLEAYVKAKIKSGEDLKYIVRTITSLLANQMPTKVPTFAGRPEPEEEAPTTTLEEHTVNQEAFNKIEEQVEDMVTNLAEEMDVEEPDI